MWHLRQGSWKGPDYKDLLSHRKAQELIEGSLRGSRLSQNQTCDLESSREEGRLEVFRMLEDHCSSSGTDYNVS